MNNKEDILFSIIMPTYNRAQLISETIKSVLNQKYSNWELIIVDDGSTDNTKDVVGTFNDKRIQYFYKKNEERSIARNFGIGKAKGEYISFLDDDDLYLPEFLSKFYHEIILKQRQVAIFMCDEYVENENGDRKLNHVPKGLLDNPVRLLWEIKTSIRPFVFHREIFEKDTFKENCPYGQDFHLVLRLVLKFPFYYIPIGLSINKIHQNQGTHSKFIENYRSNADLSINCIDDLINNYKLELLKYIDKGLLFDLHNHKVYGFASAAMKQGDFSFWWELLKNLNLSGSISKTAYYLSSLIGRIPYYWIVKKIS